MNINALLKKGQRLFVIAKKNKAMESEIPVVC
jgi:hypothetical protein